MKILHIDVETAPNLATVWGIWNQNIALNQLLETSRIMCYAAKWHGAPRKEVMFETEWSGKLLLSLHTLLDEADVVVHYNGNRFDIPTINREFLKEGWHPPTPYKNVDLYTTVKKKFRFVSNKLDHISDELGLGRKVQHEGMELWLKCMDNSPAEDPKSWKTMEKYNIQDVLLLEKAYNKLLPWISNHPNHGLYSDSDTPVCPNCGSKHLHKKGVVYTKTMMYQRYKCTDCGANMRGRTNISTDNQKHNVIVGAD